MPYPRSFFCFFEIKICKNKKYSYLCTPNRWVRITVSTRDSQSRNRSSILLPSTKSAAFKRGSAFFDIIDILATGATRNRGKFRVRGASSGAEAQVHEQAAQVPGQAAQVPGQTAQVPGVNGAGSRTGGASSGCQRRRSTDRRRKFRVSTAQVPKQGLNLHRESAFYVAPVAQVSALKWNLRHLWLNLSHLRLNLRRLSLNLRHRGASGLFCNSPADVRTKKRQSSAVAMYVHR